MAHLRPRRRVGRLLGAGVLAVVVALLPSAWTRLDASPRIHDVAAAPAVPVALVLGASVSGDGQPSPFLASRLELARRLFQAGRVRAILVSGDNGSRGYDEPTAMRNWLIARGVPAGKVVADFAGFDTYDSCYRAQAIFGAHQVVVVTQTYHLYRAVTTCRALGLDATGVGDSSVGFSSQAWRRGILREIPAVWKMAWDVWTHRVPTLGPRETSLDEALR